MFVPPAGRSIAQSLQLVDVGVRRRLAPPAGAGQHARRPGPSPGLHVALGMWRPTRVGGQEVPTEAEWEFAARGGLDGAEYAWGDKLTPGGRQMANTWQGEFPYQNTAARRLRRHLAGRIVPAQRLRALGHDRQRLGVDDRLVRGTSAVSHGCCRCRIPGRRSNELDPSGSIGNARRVMKGGSHLCAPNYCQRYRPAARMPQSVDTSTSHLGFRLIVRPGDD